MREIIRDKKQAYFKATVPQKTKIIDSIVLVTGMTTDEYFASKENIAPRPLQSTLDLSKLQVIGFEPEDWRANLHEYINK